MAPKKRPRLAPPTTATSIADVSKVQLKLGEWLQETHGLRHCSDQAPTAPDAGHEGVKGWPGVKPGTFRAIAKQIWSNPGRLLKGSLDMLTKAGILQVGSTMEDLNVACTKLHVLSSISMINKNDTWH